MNENRGLLLSKRFGPLFAAQGLGAFTDNLFKQAIVLVIMFRLAEAAPFDPAVAVTVAAGVFILPFFLLSASAGQLADAMPKHRLIRRVKWAELAIMSVGAAGLLAQDAWIMLAALAAMGAQSALFGPAKYASLPALLRADELLRANGLVQASTFLAILAGTVLGGLAMMLPSGPEIAACAVLAFSAIGLASAYAIPEMATNAPGTRANWNLPRETWRIMRDGLARRDLRWCLIGTCFFWLSGMVYVSLAPLLAQQVLGGGEGATTLILTSFALGVGVGAIGISRLLKGRLTPAAAPAAAAVIALAAGAVLYLAAGDPASAHGAFVADGPSAFTLWRADGGDWFLLPAALFVLAAAGGAFVTPLHAVIQHRAPAAEKARIVAANNVIDSAGMVVSAGGAAALLAFGASLTAVLFLACALSALVAFGLAAARWRPLARALVRMVLRCAFGLRARGLEHVRAAGPRAVIAPNHASFLDGVLLGALLPGRPVFAVNLHQARKWWVRLALAFVDHVAIDPQSPMAARRLTRMVASGRHLVIFPEGRITTTGGLMRAYPGPGVIAEKAGAVVIPVRIEGAERTLFSRMGGKMRRALLPRISVDVHPPCTLDIGPEPRGRRRRAALQARLQTLMSEAAFASADTQTSLWRALLRARRLHGGRRRILDDADNQPMSATGLVRACLALGRTLARRTADGETVGVLLPTSRGGAVTVLALQAFGRVPAMLNFTAGSAGMNDACRTAGVRTVLTSRRFVERAKLEEAVAGLAAETVFLEDLRAEIGVLAKLRAVLAAAFHPEPTAVHPDAPAVVLFTSGSEGAPKGVALSHRNILANCAQLRARVGFSPADVVLNVLPIFHAFGLTGGLYLPLLHGVPTVCHPSPLHYRYIPEIAYARNATILFATDTFLRGYARTAQDTDFDSLRFVFAGAERLRPETRREWAERFGVRVLEGYGATECAPVIAVNTPIENRPGTVGKLLPGMRMRLAPVDGVTEGGRLLVAGENVMLGYMRSTAPGRIEPRDDWYDTGDVVREDSDGFLVIEGRTKRFAKVAGEMVSLGAVEALADRVDPHARHAAVALPDPRKGERIALVTDSPTLDRAALRAAAGTSGASDLAVPAVVERGEIPVLGTGKTDYTALRTRLLETAA